MPKATTNKRSRLIQTATKLSYRHGFNRVSLADIAKEADVPLGNVHYYFKTKGELGEAVIEERLLRLKSSFQKWEKADSPADRLCAFLQTAIDVKEVLARRGCPLGTLCSELQKDTGALADKSASIFEELLNWIEAQFRDIGEIEDARGSSIHLLCALQGTSVLAHSLNNTDLVVAEVKRLQKWVREI